MFDNPVGTSARGATLIVALVILLAVTLLGVASLRSGIFHERMSLNSQAETLTFLGAESSINGILSFADQIGQGGVDESFFSDAVLGANPPQINCVTKSGITPAACADINDALDTRNEGVLFGQAHTVYDNATKVFNSDPDTLAYHNFTTTAYSYLRTNLELPFATKNKQGWQKLGVAMPFTVSQQDVLAARAQSQN